MSDYHLIGIGGIGMSGLAHIFLDQGAKVTGSDLASSYVTKGLEKRAAKIDIGHAKEHVPDGVTVIYSGGILDKNPEMIEAKKRDLPLFHRAEMLQKLCSQKKTLAVTGTHGKTSTSSMLAWIFHCAGLDPSFAVGGMIRGFDVNGRYGSGEHFVIEADESDSSFLHYYPEGMILTNIGWDHLPNFASKSALVEAFAQFARQSKRLVWCGEDERLKEMKLDGIDYGFYFGASMRGVRWKVEGWKTKFSALFLGKDLGEFSIPLVGRHYAQNALGVIALGLEFGVPLEKIREGLATFPGVKRRGEIIGIQQGVCVIDDYAHHATEIGATLKGIRQSIGQRPLIALFQPHRFTRTKECLHQFQEAFNEADLVAVSEIYSANESPIEGIHSKSVVSSIGPHATYVPLLEMVDWAIKNSRKGTVIILMGAGTITEIGGALLHALKRDALKQNVTILAGGASPEHAISLESARFVMEGIDREQYNPELIIIDRQGNFDGSEVILEKTLQKLISSTVVFPVLHGPKGEDGTIQGFLESLNIPYVGCDMQSASICMDKVATKRILRDGGLKVAPFILAEESIETIEERFHYPLFVKARHLGSSIGVYRVLNQKELLDALESLKALNAKGLIEKEILGREIEFAVIGSDNPRVFAPGEILLREGFYDYEAKYGENKAETEVVAKFSENEIARLQHIVSRGYKLLGCKGMARIDGFYTQSGEFYFNEVNPIPGMTANSLFPKMCAAGGLPPKQLIETLLNEGKSRWKKG